jgi:hypothetical protein
MSSRAAVDVLGGSTLTRLEVARVDARHPVSGSRRLKLMSESREHLPRRGRPRRLWVNSDWAFRLAAPHREHTDDSAGVPVVMPKDMVGGRINRR